MRFSFKDFTRLGATFALLAIGDVGDYIESLDLITRTHIVHAGVDNIIHTVIGVLTWTVISDEPWKISFELLGVAIISSAIDLDHFIAARTITINGALNAPHRGIFHCSGLLLSVSILLLLCKKPQWALILFVSFIPHHLRDATRRGLYLCPPYIHSNPLPKSLVRLILPIFPWLVVLAKSYIFMDSKPPREVLLV